LSSPEAAAAPAAERIHAIDAVRGVALAGVLLANLVLAFRVPASQAYLPDDPAMPWLDWLIEGLVEFAIQGKAITLFSVLFGVGLAIQYERFSRRPDPVRWLARRLAALALFGLVHLTLVWNGDILTEYALSGFLVMPFLAAGNRTVARLALVLYGLYVVAPGLPFYPPWPDEAVLRAEMQDALRIYGNGTWAEIRRYSLHEWKVFSPIYLSLFTVTPALLMAGLLLWRSGVLRDLERSRALLRRAAWAGLGLGLPLTALVQWAPSALPVAVFAAAALAPALTAMGYGAAILLLVQSGRCPRLLAGFAAAGRMAFTNYNLQSLVFPRVWFG
jgi:uncharacterized protein